MVEYRLISENGTTVTYHYFPEGHEDYGTVTVEKNTGKVLETKLAKGDEFKWYFYHLIDKIEEFTENGEFRKEGYVAWY